MRNNKLYSTILIYLALFSFLFCMPATSYSYQLFHTVQIGSFKTVNSAQKQFDTIAKELNENKKDLDNLRIEKIGKYYSVRVGKFNNSNAAEKTLKKIKHSQPQATVMTAYIKDERIIKFYGASTSAVVKEKAKEKPVPITASKNPVPEVTKKIDLQGKHVSIPIPPKTDPIINEKNIKKEKPISLKEKIITISSLVEKNNLNSALDITKNEIAAHPEHADLNAWHGMILIKMDKPLEAVKYLKKATELSPKVADYHNALAYSLFFIKKYDGAINEFNKAIAIEPIHIDALTGLCIVYTSKGEKDKATEIYDRIKDVDSEISNKLTKLIET